MPNRLSLGEDRLFPVQAFFNAVSDFNFVEVVSRLLRGIGHSSDYAHCRFPDDLDPGEETFDGVQFSLFEDSVVITIEELNRYVREACQSYLDCYPDEQDEIGKLLTSSEATPDPQ